MLENVAKRREFVYTREYRYTNVIIINIIIIIYPHRWQTENSLNFSH